MSLLSNMDVATAKVTALRQHEPAHEHTAEAAPCACDRTEHGPAPDDCAAYAAQVRHGGRAL